MVMRKSYTQEQIMAKFKKLPLEKRYEILDKALTLVLSHRAGTREYAIAYTMGYCYQDDGSYSK